MQTFPSQRALCFQLGQQKKTPQRAMYPPSLKLSIQTSEGSSQHHQTSRILA